MESEHPEDALPEDFADGFPTLAQASSYLASVSVRRTVGTLAIRVAMTAPVWASRPNSGLRETCATQMGYAAACSIAPWLT